MSKLQLHILTWICPVSVLAVDLKCSIIYTNPAGKAHVTAPEADW